MENHNPNQQYTIIGVPYDGPRPTSESLCVEQAERVGTQEHIVQNNEFKIRLANNAGRRSDASMLIQERYAWRGYTTSSGLEESPNRVTIIASDRDKTIGTVSIGLDSQEQGLLVDQLYKDIIDPMRKENYRLCEFIKLAIDGEVKSKKVLAALFHIGVLYAQEVFKQTHVVIEVHPRHVKFYERMIGFQVIGPERSNPRVNAPAVLLSVSLEYVRLQVAQLGGRRDLANTTRSIYPYFFSPDEANGIVGRIMGTA